VLPTAHPRVRAAVLDAMSAGPISALLAYAESEPGDWLARRAVQSALRLDRAGLPALAHHHRAPFRAAAAAELRRRAAWSEADLDPNDADDEVAWTALVARRRRGEERPKVLDRGLFLAAQSSRPVQVDGPDDLESIRALDDQRPEHILLVVSALTTLDEELALLAAIGRLAASSLDVATEALVDATRHPLEGVRAAATRALDGRTGARVWDAYRHRARYSPDPDVRESVVWTIGRRNEPEGLDLLVDWADVGDLQEAAAEALLARVKRSVRFRTPAVRAALDRLAAGTEKASHYAHEALARF
jgi:hypothetical protein